MQFHLQSTGKDLQWAQKGTSCILFEIATAQRVHLFFFFVTSEATKSLNNQTSISPGVEKLDWGGMDHRFTGKEVKKDVVKSDHMSCGTTSRHYGANGYEMSGDCFVLIWELNLRLARTHWIAYLYLFGGHTTATSTRSGCHRLLVTCLPPQPPLPNAFKVCPPHLYVFLPTGNRLQAVRWRARSP